MAASYLDAIDGVIDRGLASGIASRSGESEQSVARGIRATASALLAGIVARLGDQAGFRRLFDLVASRGADVSAFDDSDTIALADRFDSVGERSFAAGEFADSIFAGRTGQVESLVARDSGLRASTVASLFPLVSGLVLHQLHRHVTSEGLTADTFRDRLSQEKDSILAAAPLGLSTMLGQTETPVEMHTAYEQPASYDRVESERRRERSSEVPVSEHGRSRHRWLWPTVGALAVIALLWSALGRRERRAESEYAAGEVTRVIVPPGDSVSVAVMSRRLPDGTTINVATDGTESRLIGFISDPNRPVDESTWFALDRLSFESGSAKLTPESDKQIEDIAAVMRAYPNTAAKIGGFTDNVGDARANVRLSRDRANAVRDALIAKGVQPGRLIAEGYGAKMPIADNSTEEGRARNRRISILVTKK